MTGSASARPARFALLAAALAYAAVLLVRFRTAPDGLVNDQAEELLRGLILVSERRLEILTFTVGNSAETLWLYVLGLSATLLGPSVLALVLPSALAAAATAWATARFYVARRPDAPWWIPFLLAAGSPWLFAYGRSGFRAITAPLGVALAALLLQRGESSPGRTWPWAAAGGVVGLSLYGYTAARLLPLALAAAFGVALLRDPASRPWRLRAALACASGFVAVSIPNLLFLARHPVEFFVRGGYSVIGGAAGKLDNVLATVALPLHYPDRYRFVWGDAHVLDAFSASVTGSGVDPVPLVSGLLAAIGLVVTLRRDRDLPAVFLVATHVLAVVFLGPLGPSLTRLLLLVPVFVFYASEGVLDFAKGPRARLAAGVLLSLVAIFSLTGYVSRLSDPGRRAREYVGEAQTAMGERARVVSAKGPVLAVVSDDASVVRALAFGTPTSVVEFRRRPFDVREVAPELSARTLLVETHPVFEPWHPPGFVEGASPDARWRELTPAPGGEPVSALPRRERLALLAASLAYGAVLLFRFRTVPDGLVNDTAEEMLKGLALVESRRLEVLTSTLGYSAETLWLYVMGLCASVLGPTVAAAVLPSALAAVLTAVTLALLVRELEPDLSPAAGFLLAAGSPWLFHYGRSGLRVAAAALFCALTGLLVARATRAGARPRAFFLAGAVSALGAYVYTTCRALPIAVVAAAVWHALRAAPENRGESRRAAGAAILGIFLFSLPNLAFFATHPKEFLERGRYVYVGGGEDRAANARATLALPFGFPDAYRGVSGTGASYDADGVSATFSAAGLNPLPLWITLLSGVGLLKTLRMKWEGPEAFLLGALALALAVLAPAGPSLSRLFILLPILLAFAGRGTGPLARLVPWRAAVPLALLLGGAFSIGSWFKALGGPAPPPFVAQAATAIGERARLEAPRGPVWCVVSRDASVVRYLAHGTPTTVVEFFGVPFDARRAAPSPDVATLLVERNPAFDAWKPDGFRETLAAGNLRVLERAIPPSGP